MPADIIIRKQRIKVKTNNENHAFKVRKQVNDQLQYDLLPVYESTFGKINEDLFIDKISINLGTCKLEELSIQFPQKLKDALENWIIEEKRSGKWEQGHLTFHTNTTAGKEKPKKANKIFALIYYLEKGIYPWWFKNDQKNIQNFISVFTEIEMKQFLSSVVNFIQNASNEKKRIVVTRLLQQVNELFFEKLINGLTELLHDATVEESVRLLSAKQTINVFKEWFFISEKEYRRSLLNYLLDIIGEKTQFSVNSFLSTFIYLENRKGLLEKFVTENISLNRDQKELDKRIDSLSERLKKIIVEVYESFIFNTTNGSKSVQKTMDKRDQLGKANESRVSEIFSEEEGIYIINAGLIILHPFLTALFGELKLLGTDHNFLSVECQYRAIVLLNYLCTGKNEYSEPDLAFSKILCGLKPEDNITGGIQLTEGEKKECDQLLNMVISYWEALKGSGKEAMQETFFRRNGKLSFNNNHYLLQVEKNATDILIERLPWGIGIIQLPWMGHLIYVEW